MLELIDNIFNSSIVVNWIAPIVVTVLGSIIVKLLFDKKKSKSIIYSINVANNRFVEAVRPFFIQEIEFNMEIIDDIRNAIIREYSVDENMLYTTNQLKEFLILDVVETRYLTEERKKDLISCICSLFNKLDVDIHNEDSILQPIEILKNEKDNLNNYNFQLSIILYVTSISVFLIILASKIKEVELFFQNELLTVVSTICSLLVVLVTTYITTNYKKQDRRNNKIIKKLNETKESNDKISKMSLKEILLHNQEQKKKDDSKKK